MGRKIKASQLFTGDLLQPPRNAEGVLRNIRKAHRYGTADCIIVLNLLISFVKLYAKCFKVEHPERIELSNSGWKPDILPLNYGCIWCQRRDSNPHLAVFRTAISAVGLLWHSVSLRIRALLTSDINPCRCFCNHLLHTLASIQ